MKNFIATAIIVFALGLITPYNVKAEGTGSNVGYGVGSVLASCVYSPAKLVYAGVGGLTGGIGFLLTGGNQDVAKKIWTPSVRGTYVVTPDMLKGKEKVQFVGKPEDCQPPSNQPQENQVQEDSLAR
jgi:hypothetical protein